MADRRQALDGAVLPRGARFTLSACAPTTRLVMRGGAAAASLCGAAFGAELSLTPLRAHERGPRAALWLAPDEWLLIADDAPADALVASLEGAIGAEPHALVDVSHRNAGLALEGAGAARLLNSGVMLDLDLAAFPVGTSTRTLLVKAEIVLWRRDPQAFRLECGRSFAPYVAAILAQAAQDQELC